MDDIPEKDMKYVKYYQPNDMYWGLGLENELYFILNKPIEKPGYYIRNNRRRERYSVDYNNNYDQEKLVAYLSKVFLDSDTYRIPQYINSHTYTRTDVKGQHQTMYTVGREPNPKFNGRILHDQLRDEHPMFDQDYGDKYVFDGDTIEFITQDFYKTTVNKCVTELVNYKDKFLKEINKFHQKHALPTVNYPKINYGLVQFRTNPNNISVFNNGTYHINITLPTKLDSDAKIADVDLFKKQHQNALKLLQWIEPLIISIYGSPDVFAFDDNNRYSSGSLRLTASRYIGIGTYDVGSMIKGKLLQSPKRDMPVSLNSASWYNQLYKRTAYLPGENIGFDINYAKHYNAGIEFRIFDYFPEEALADLMNFLVLLLDHSLENDIMKNASDCPDWHNFTTDVLHNGHTAKLPYELILVYIEVLNFPVISECEVKKYLVKLVNFLYDKYHNSLCASCMSPQMSKPQLHNVNQYMWDNNYLQYIPINNPKHVRVTKLYSVYQKLHKNKSSMVLDKNNRLHNLLINSGLHLVEKLTLDEFYARLLKLADDKLDMVNYVLV